MNRPPHSGKYPPQIPRIPSTTLRVLPPESPLPVTELPGNATQATKGPSDADGYVDLGAGRRQQVNHTGGLPCAHLQSRQPQRWPSQHKAVQPQLQTPQHEFPPVPPIGGLKVVNLSQLPEFLMKQQQQQQQYQQQLQTAHPTPELPDPLSALQHQPAHKKPAWKKSKVAPPDQRKAFNAEDLPLPGFQVPAEDDLGCLKLKHSSTKPDKLCTQPPDTFEEGKVLLCSGKGCEDILLHVDELRETTGVLLNDHFKPDGDRYEDGVHYTTVRRLGMGSFGTVDLCVDSESQQQFVRKKVKKTSFRPTEVSVPVKLPHNNFTHVYGIIYNPESVELFILIEYAGTALNHYVAKERDLWKDEKKMLDLVRQGFRALAHLERYGIKHLDIKPENLCVLKQDDGNLVLKLTDFGSARTPQQSLQFVGMTPEYVAPEMAKLFLQLKFKTVNWNPVSEIDVTGKVDVFAFGLVIMFIYKGYHILQKLITKGQTSYDSFTPKQQQLLQTQLLVQLASDSNFVKSLIPDECSLKMRELVSVLVEHDHNKRRTASSILQQLTECMDMDGGPVITTTKDFRRKKIAQPYKGSGKGFKGSGKGFKGSGKGCKGSGKVRSYTEAGLGYTEPGSYRGRQVASKPMYGVTESHAPIAQPSMETDSINLSEMIADSPPIVNIQACPTHQVNQTRLPPQPMHRYATQTSALDVDLSRRRVPSPRTVQSQRPQNLPMGGQAASQTTRPFTKREELNQQILHASSQLQQMTPESPPTPEPTPMNQDLPAARMPDFAQLFDDDI